MADELEKLRERVQKDPNSKLFVSLADQYNKLGKTDEAIEMLKAGIERQPLYMSARVALAKIYIEKNSPQEARKELEKVIQAIPDNLFAQRKLADIYLQMGDREQALSAFQASLRLNPMDEEAGRKIAELEKPEPDKAIGAEGLMETTSLAAAEREEEESQAGEFRIELGPEDGENAAEETGAELDIMKPEDAFNGQDWFSEKETPETVRMDETAQFETAEPVEINEAAETPENTGGPEWLKETVPMEEAMPVPEPANVLPESARTHPCTPPQEGTQIRVRPVQVSLDEGDAFVAGGYYARALAAYEKYMGRNPGDKKGLQKLSELKMLIKLLGKSKEVKAERLQAFAETAKRKKDEFFGNP